MNKNVNNTVFNLGEKRAAQDPEPTAVPSMHIEAEPSTAAGTVVDRLRPLLDNRLANH